MRVGDDEVAVVVDAEAAGPALAVVGRGPGQAEVLAVEVVDLDAGGEIDDVEAVVRRWRRPAAGPGRRPARPACPRRGPAAGSPAQRPTRAAGRPEEQPQGSWVQSTGSPPRLRPRPRRVVFQREDFWNPLGPVGRAAEQGLHSFADAPARGWRAPLVPRRGRCGRAWPPGPAGGRGRRGKIDRGEGAGRGVMEGI